jgi:hypothetical protein
MKLEQIELNLSEMASLLGVTAPSILKWDIPVKIRDGKKLYPLKECVRFRLASIEKDVASKSDSLTAARTRLANTQSEKTELEVEQIKGNLIPADIVNTVWSEQAEILKSKLFAIPTRLNLILAGTSDPIEVEEILRHNIEIPFVEYQDIDQQKYVERLKQIEKYTVSESEEDDDKGVKKSSKKSGTSQQTNRKRMGK